MTLLEVRLRSADRHCRGEGNAVRLPDGQWHVGFDLSDDKAVAATSYDLFAAVGSAKAALEYVANR